MQRPKPLPPSPEDCCGQGCTPCVNDIYDTELKMWENEVIKNSKTASVKHDCDLNTFSRVIFRDTYTLFTIKEILPVIGNTFIYRFELPSPNSSIFC